MEYDVLRFGTLGVSSDTVAIGGCHALSEDRLC